MWWWSVPGKQPFGIPLNGSFISHFTSGVFMALWCTEMASLHIVVPSCFLQPCSALITSSRLEDLKRPRYYRELLMSPQEIMHSHRKCRLMKSCALYHLWFFSLFFLTANWRRTTERYRSWTRVMSRCCVPLAFCDLSSNLTTIMTGLAALVWFCGLYFCPAPGPLTIITYKMNIPSKNH